jgi:protein SCO1/2
MNQVTTPTKQPAPVRRGRIGFWVAVLATFAAVCAGAAFWLQSRGDGSGYKYYGQWIGKEAPDFALTNQEGATTRLASLRGNLILMTFGFTHCPNICPTTLANLAAICDGLPPFDRDRVRVLFISVDPTRDTPAVLKQYVTFYNPRFAGLTGSPDQIAAVAKEYGAYYEPVMQQSQVAGDYYTINHSAYVYLIDPAGQYAVLYDNDKLLDHASMDRDIEHLLAR